MFFLIDKPLGISSFDVIRRLRKSLGIKKMGHTGTLDPLASGCLLIATDWSTKLIPLLEWARKEYIFTVSLDGRTDSLDLGTPVEKIDIRHIHIPSDEEICSYILSQKEQIPPKYSALHVDGKRAYELAAEGEQFSLKSRPVNIYDVRILGRTDISIDIQMTISSGGYVRSFAPLLWAISGVDGWYISTLLRTQIVTDYGSLHISHASSIEDPKMLDYSVLFPTIPTLDISQEVYTAIRDGKILPLETIDTIERSQPEYCFTKYMAYISLLKREAAGYIIVRNDV